MDLSHHLSDIAKARRESPLKGLQRYNRPGVIKLAGGLPSPGYFPVDTLEAEVLPFDIFPTQPVMASQTSSQTLSTWFWSLFGTSSLSPIPPKTTHITVPKFASPGELSLETALQYGVSRGLPQLTEFIQEFMTKVYRPAFPKWTTLIHAGNTDGVFKAVMTLCNRGECIIVDEWTYPSTMSTMYPLGVSVVPVKLDEEGMRVDDLRRVLSEWDESKTGAKRPHVMYIVPIGQNPCGLTMGAERKKAIYSICVEYDIIIIEDDPYYFLQEGTYLPPTARKAAAKASSTMSDEAWVRTLSPSFLQFDYQGRVIRLDTFSKVVAPGSRLGWFTCNPMFAERLERQGETSTQAPCGFGQSVITELLINEWGYQGFVRWLRGLTNQYTARRNFIMDVIGEEFDLSSSSPSASTDMWANLPVYTARPRVHSRLSSLSEKDVLFSRRRLFSIAPPSSGMYVWIRVYLEDHPAYAPGEEETLEQRFVIMLAEAGLLVGPGWFFDSEMFAQQGVELPERPAGEAHYRLSFSLSDQAEMRKAIQIFKETLERFNSGVAL